VTPEAVVRKRTTGLDYWIPTVIAAVYLKSWQQQQQQQEQQQKRTIGLDYWIPTAVYLKSWQQQQTAAGARLLNKNSNRSSIFKVVAAATTAAGATAALTS
jgi:hypothetical protein